MKKILFSLSLFGFVSLSWEICEYKRGLNVHVFAQEWWTIGGEHSEEYHDTVSCFDASVNTLQGVNYRQERPYHCDRNYHYRCPDREYDVYSALFVGGNIPILSAFASGDVSPLIGIEMSDINVQAIHENVFQPFHNLKEINLRKNNISSLPDGLFTSNTNLRIVDLSNNIISSIKDSMFPSQSLRYLNLRYNKLQTPNFQLSTSLVNLELSFNSISSISKNFFSNMKQLQVLHLSHNAVEVLTNRLLTENTNLEFIDLSFNNISNVAKVVFFLHRVKNLNMQYNKIQNINFTLPISLHSLDLSFNKISSIKHDTFSGMNELITLKLNDNALEVFPSGLCDTLENLNEINLQRNNISFVTNQTFAFNNKLKVVNLAENNIFGIETTAFSSENIEYLNLAHNKIQTINFTIPTRTKTLDLQHNNISHINDNSFVNTSNIEELYLNNNALKIIPPKLFKSLNNVKYINLQQNNLSMLPDELFTSNNNLNLTLILSHNRISVVNNETFPLHGIAYLYMQHNELTNISFKLPSSLIHLNFSSNLISGTKNDSFNGLTALESLWLDNNFLRTTPAGFFKPLINLKYLYLSNNKIAIKFGVTFAGLNNLILLDISNNSLLRLQDYLFFDLKNLVSLDISNNLLNSFAVGNIKKFLKNLNTIYLDKNKFECPYLWDLISRLNDNGVSIPEGKQFLISNVQGIECISTDAPEKQLKASDTQLMKQMLKEMFSDVVANEQLTSKTFGKQLESTLQDINSSLVSVKQLSKSSGEHIQNILQEIAANLSTEGKLHNISLARLMDALEQMSKSNLNSTEKALENSSFERKLETFLKPVVASLNSTTAQLKKFEDFLEILTKTNKLSIDGNNRFVRIESAKRIDTSQNEQMDVYFPIQTVVLFVLLVLILVMFYFVFRQFRNIKNRSKVSVTEMDRIVTE